jgi:hypothetical protein
MSPCAYTAGRRRIARMIRLAGVAAGQARRADLPAALALTASRARSASRSRSPCRESASWVVMVYMMFSFRSSPPRLAAVHTGDERAGAGWTAHGKYPRSASGAGGSGAAGDAGARRSHGVSWRRPSRAHCTGAERTCAPEWLGVRHKFPNGQVRASRITRHMACTRSPRLASPGQPSSSSTATLTSSAAPFGNAWPAHRRPHFVFTMTFARLGDARP